ncbi:MAG: amidohydrolase family protein [Myxococcota bacterium]
MEGALERMPIIDIDTHYTEPPDLWTARAPAKYKGRVPRVERSRSGRDVWVVEDGVRLGPAGVSVIRRDGTKAYGEFSLKTLDEMTETATDPRARLAAMDELAVYAQIVYPNALGFSGAFLLRVEDLELRNHCVSTYNDAVAELQAAGEGRIYPQAVLPFWDLARAIEELRRCRKTLGLTGFTMTDSPQDWGLPPLHDPYWDPFWTVAQDLELPVNFHIGASTIVDPCWAGYEPRRQIAVMSVCVIMNNLRCLTNLIFSGLLDRFPALNFVSVESGVGWVPFLLEACEYQMDQNMGPGRCGLKLRPREYFERQIYTSFWFEKENLAHAVEILGEDHVMFETDVPHPTCLYPDMRRHLEGALGGLGEHVQRKVLYETAASLYQIPLPS